LGKVGAYAPGETLDAEDSAHGLLVLQDLLAEWGDGGLVVPSLVIEAVTLVADQASYTIGEDSSADLNTIRPEQIIGAYVRQSNYDYPVTIIGEDAYSSMTAKSTAARPEFLWYNPTAPLGTAYVYPAANSTDSLYITSVKPFTEPTGLTQEMLDDISVPRNYHNALVWNLAVELAQDYGFEVTVLIGIRAAETKSKIEALNAARRVQAVPLEIEPMTGGRYSVLTG